MNLNLESYVIKVGNFIPSSICKDINKNIEKNKNWKKHDYYDSFKKEFKKINGKNELEINNEEIKQTEYLMNKIKESAFDFKK